MSSQGHLDPTVPTTAPAGRFLLSFLRTRARAASGARGGFIATCIAVWRRGQPWELARGT